VNNEDRILQRDIAYVKKGNFKRDLGMFREWVNGDSFKPIGLRYGCRPSQTASVCRKLASKIIELNQWDGELTRGKYDGKFPESTRQEWLNAIDEFEKRLTSLRK